MRALIAVVVCCVLGVAGCSSGPTAPSAATVAGVYDVAFDPADSTQAVVMGVFHLAQSTTKLDGGLITSTKLFAGFSGTAGAMGATSGYPHEIPVTGSFLFTNSCSDTVAVSALFYQDGIITGTYTTHGQCSGISLAGTFNSKRRS